MKSEPRSRLIARYGQGQNQQYECDRCDGYNNYNYSPEHFGMFASGLDCLESQTCCADGAVWACLYDCPAIIEKILRWFDTGVGRVISDIFTPSEEDSSSLD
jgi:hypothetical protein